MQEGINRKHTTACTIHEKMSLMTQTVLRKLQKIDFSFKLQLKCLQCFIRQLDLQRWVLP